MLPPAVLTTLIQCGPRKDDRIGKNGKNRRHAFISFTDCLVRSYSFISMTKDNGRHSDEEVWLFGIGEKAILCSSDSCLKCSLLPWDDLSTSPWQQFLTCVRRPSALHMQFAGSIIYKTGFEYARKVDGYVKGYKCVACGWLLLLCYHSGIS